MKNILRKLKPKSRAGKDSETNDTMKYLIIGLGNMGIAYENTRHNLGFQALDRLAEKNNLTFQPKRHADVAGFAFKGRTFKLVKPSTLVNLSGKAVNYWMQKEHIPPERMLILVDDVSLPFGTIRIKSQGGDAGHNGLAHINRTLGHQNYPRLRFGIGNGFHKGQQVDYVLGEWTDEEREKLPERLDKVAEAIKSFGTIGLERTMNFFNGK